MLIRKYDRERDQMACRRIWREIGWLDAGQEPVMDLSIEAGDAYVAEVDGEAECLVQTSPGVMRYQSRRLPFCGVTGVATSHLVRRQGFASQLTAHAIARRAAAGDLVAGLGVFDQGFYDRLGMGTGAYERQITLDPSSLRVSGRPRIPVRLTANDWEEIHQARLGRLQGHGAVTLTPAATTHADVLTDGNNGFGLGYRDGPARAISHHIWVSTEDMSRGPYHIVWMSYQTGQQLVELLQVIKSLGDQVLRVVMQEPAHVMMQDLVDQPFKKSRMTRDAKGELGVTCKAWWQARILDLEACLAATSVPGDGLVFNLALSDPIAAYLPEGAQWRGIAGEYVVSVGPESSARRGHDPALPTLSASVNAFTRLWLGVRPASGLAVSDDLRGPDELLATLDRTWLLPEPHLDWPL